jgi:S1-C subfamily serine protease
MATKAPQRRGVGRQVRDRVFGDERRLGLWMLPLFLLTALLGATVVGGLAVLYYGQQVSRLEETTARARAQLDGAVADVEGTAERATKEIDDQVREVRESLAQGSPIASPNEGGIYAVAATHPDGETRVGSTFTVFSNDTETFLLTSYALVATEDEFALETVELFLPNSTITVRVHNFDAESDLAVLIARGGPLPVLKWRPAGREVKAGDTIFAAGIAGSGLPAVIEGRIGGVSDRAIVPDVPLNAFLAGAPLLDAQGDVVAVASQRYAPFGEVDGGLTYAPPIRSVCETLLDCTAADEGGGRGG